MSDEFRQQESFLTTRWSVVLDAQRQSDSTRVTDALSHLCRIYWYPLYAFVRRNGHSPHDAQDLTQEFFRRLLGKDYLAAADPARGRFRSFLLSALKHFLANEWDRSHAQKRGGGNALISLDDVEAEARYALEPVDNCSPDKLFERRWATILLDQVLARLRRDYAAAGKAELYDVLKECLTFESATALYTELAARLNMSEGAVKVAVHRLRARYRELLREEIAQTVSSPAEVEEEIRQLFTALAAR
jgi:RNA polymerase sigma factor (sigma-70 family)